jgi:hypothetical protein
MKTSGRLSDCGNRAAMTTLLVTYFSSLSWILEYSVAKLK